MSTKVYYAWRTDLHNLVLARDWLYLSIWRKTVAWFRKFKLDPCSYDSVSGIIDNDMRSGFHIFIDDSKAYFIGYGWGATRVGRPPWWLDNYSYWNNSDHPTNIKYEEWVDRGRIWNRVAIDRDAWAKRLTCAVVDMDTVYDMMCEISPRARKNLRVKAGDLKSKQPLPSIPRD